MSERMYPIQDGPSVPWSVIAPHENQCQKNHGQSIERIAERGGFGCCEAWCVVNGVDYYDERQKGVTAQEMKRKWIEYADRINNHYDELNQLKSTLTHYESALKEAKCFLDRLGSMEAFCAPRAVHSSNDEELLARIDYAREKSESLSKVLGEK